MLNYSVFSVFLWYFIDFYIDNTCIVAHRSKSTNRHEERSKSSPLPTPLSGGGPITARDVERESVKSLAPAWTQSYISTCLFWHLPLDLWKAPLAPFCLKRSIFLPELASPLELQLRKPTLSAQWWESETEDQPGQQPLPSPARIQTNLHILSILPSKCLSTHPGNFSPGSAT